MPTTTEQETYPTQPSESEALAGSERLPVNLLRREVAAAAVMAILISVYAGHESDHFFSSLQEEKPATPDDPEVPVDATSNGNIYLGLLNNAVGEDTPVLSFSGLPKGHVRLFSDFQGARFDRNASAAAAPDFVPAPSLGDVAEGPAMPNLAFNDRVRPQGAQPSAADFSAAERANDMLQHSFLKAGWNGGEATPEQHRAAKLDITRNYHPDRADVAPADVAAFKEYNSSSSHAEKANAGAQAAKAARVGQPVAPAAEAAPASTSPTPPSA